MIKNIIYEIKVIIIKITALIHVWYFVCITNSIETIINILVNKFTLQNHKPPILPLLSTDSST